MIPIQIATQFLSHALFASALFLPPSFPNPKAAERLVAECADPVPKMATPACEALSHDVYAIILGNLRYLEASGASVDKGLLREALKSTDGALQAVSLRLLGAKGVDPQDVPQIEALLWSRVPAVRAQAFELMTKVPGGEKYEAWRKRFYERRGSNRDPLIYLADAIPGAKALGAELYPGARFVPFASGPRRAVFTTSDSPEKVLAHFSKGGKKVYTLAQLANPVVKQPDPQELMRRAQAGEDMQKVIQEMQQQAMGAQKLNMWAKGIKDEQGINDPRFVEIPATAGTPELAPGIPALPRTVIVYKDAILGSTAIRIPIPERMPAMSGDPLQLQLMVELQQLKLPEWKAVVP